MTDAERVLEPAEECCVCGWSFSDGGEPFVQRELSGPRKGEVLTSCMLCASTGQAALTNYSTTHKAISVVGNMILAELRRTRDAEIERLKLGIRIALGDVERGYATMMESTWRRLSDLLGAAGGGGRRGYEQDDDV